MTKVKRNYKRNVENSLFLLKQTTSFISSLKVPGKKGNDVIHSGSVKKSWENMTSLQLNCRQSRERRYKISKTLKTVQIKAQIKEKQCRSKG